MVRTPQLSKALLARHAVTLAALACVLVAPVAPNAGAHRATAEQARSRAVLMGESALDVRDHQVRAASRAPTAPLWLSIEARMRRHAASIDSASRAHGVDAALVHAMIFAESTYDPDAVSPDGAIGLMQLMPETARQYGARDPFNPHQNIHAGVRYLKDLLVRFDGDVELAVAAYNAGPGAVERAGLKIPNRPETIAFVPRVMEHYERNKGTK